MSFVSVDTYVGDASFSNEPSSPSHIHIFHKTNMLRNASKLSQTTGNRIQEKCGGNEESNIVILPGSTISGALCASKRRGKSKRDSDGDDKEEKINLMCS